MNIIFQDDHIVAVQKPPHMLVHPGGQTFKDPAMTDLLKHQLGYPVYPLYRLDRETSGIVIFAKNSEEVPQIQKELKDKTYTAVLEGELKEQITVNQPIKEIKGEHIDYKQSVHKDGKPSKTTFTPTKHHNTTTTCKVLLHSGRRHQIRVHAQFIKHPIVGDKIYGASDKLQKDFLKQPNQSRHLLHMSSITYKDNIITREPDF